MPVIQTGCLEVCSDLLVIEDELHGWDGCLLVENEDQSVAGSLHEGGFQV